MNTFLKIAIATPFLLLGSCNNTQTPAGHSHDVVGSQPAKHDHGPEVKTLSYTLFSDEYELFVEFPAFVAGNVSAFAAHFTQMKDYKPLTKGRLTVSLIRDGKGIKHTVDAPTSPGIFRPALQPKEAGTWQLTFSMETEQGESKFDAGEIEVYANNESVPVSNAPNEEEITYLKEQAWKTDFATEEVIGRPFHSVIHTSARVINQPQSQVVINAQSSGQVMLYAIAGETVNKGQMLAIVSGSGIENNITVKLDEYRINFEKSKSDYTRTKPLVEKEAVSQKDFLEIQSRYLQDSIRYFQVANNMSGKGLKVTAPFTGFISNVHVQNGESVNSGDEIMTVSQKSALLIEAYVNQSDYKSISEIFDAHFKVPSSEQVIRLSEMNGAVKAMNAFVSESSPRIPVSFTISNQDQVIPGMLLEAYLLAGRKENSLVIPLSGVMEEQGQFYVYVQSGGETFMKRQVQLGANDGIAAEVLSGIHTGERIAIKGAYQIKLASLAGDLPIHGHTH